MKVHFFQLLDLTLESRDLIQEEASLEISYLNVSTDGVCGWSNITLLDLTNDQTVTFNDTKCGIVTALSKSGYINSVKKALAQVPSCKKKIIKIYRVFVFNSGSTV